MTGKAIGGGGRMARRLGWLSLGLGLAVYARSLAAGRRGRPLVRDYGDRSGFPRPPAQMRGAARRPGITRPSL